MKWGIYFLWSKEIENYFEIWIELNYWSIRMFDPKFDRFEIRIRIRIRFVRETLLHIATRAVWQGWQVWLKARMFSFGFRWQRACTDFFLCFPPTSTPFDHHQNFVIRSNQQVIPLKKFRFIFHSSLSLCSLLFDWFLWSWKTFWSEVEFALIEFPFFEVLFY